MPPNEFSPPPFDVVTLRRAVELYLARAYPDNNLPTAVRSRVEWPENAQLADLIAGPPFERANRPAEGVVPIYALRLGNARYPHMKLQIQGWPNEEGYLLSVNTHDQVLSMGPDARGAEGFRALQTENQRLKEAIEQDWETAGLPTFLGYLREYIAQQSDDPGSTLS